VLVDAALFVQFVFGFTILVRMIQQGCVSRFPFFHSYLVYFLATGVVDVCVFAWAPQQYPTFFWIKFFTLVIAEFALLLEIGDHIFRPYAAIRKLGRLITAGITFLFSIVYILPPLIEARPTSIAILDLVKRSALTKGVIIVALLGMARFYRVRLGRNVAGLVLGFAAYMAINTANFALAESYGRELYGPIFSTVGPLSQTLCVLIWTMALWRFEPVFQPAREIATDRVVSEPLPDRLGKFNTALTRLFRK
jgi:hypothetical protein